MGFFSSDTKNTENQTTAGSQSNTGPSVSVIGDDKSSSTVIINQESPEALELAGSLGLDALNLGSESVGALASVANTALASASSANQSVKDLTGQFTSALTSIKTTVETQGQNLTLDSFKYVPQLGLLVVGAGVVTYIWRAVK